MPLSLWAGFRIRECDLAAMLAFDMDVLLLYSDFGVDTPRYTDGSFSVSLPALDTV